MEVYMNIPTDKCPTKLFLYNGPLIYFNCVEFHRIDRVKRQLGIAQDIPENPPISDDDLHQYDSLMPRKWMEIHKPYIEQWLSCNPIIRGEPSEDDIPHSSAYLNWYSRVTRLFISNPERRRHPADGVPIGQASWRHAAVSYDLPLY